MLAKLLAFTHAQQFSLPHMTQKRAHTHKHTHTELAGGAMCHQNVWEKTVWFVGRFTLSNAFLHAFYFTIKHFTVSLVAIFVENISSPILFSCTTIYFFTVPLCVMLCVVRFWLVDWLVGLWRYVQN